METDSDLVKWQPIRAMIEQYNQAQAEITEGFKLLASAKQRMKVFGTYNDSIIKRDLRDYEISNGATKGSLDVIKKGAWRGIVDRTQVRNLMTEKRVGELDRQLETGEGLPPLTMESVQAFLEELGSNMDSLLSETLTEAFETLRPRRSEYKTNTEYEIGERAILNYVIDHDNWGFTRLSHYREASLRSIDNAFHLLDGKGPVKFPGDLVTMVRGAIQDKEWQCETEYFECKWYKKGSFHVRFKRLDLVKELNRRAGGNRLKGA